MPYTIKETESKMHVLEEETGQVIYTTSNKKSARMLCRSLNLGSGFDGLTPGFFTQTYKKGDP